MDNTVDKMPSPSSAASATSSPGPFLATVVSHLDSSYMGGLEVQIQRPSGNDSSEGQLHQVKYMSPFYGVTSVEFNGKDPNNFKNTQKSYGMWMIPPDPGTTVVIIFIDGDPKRGYWIGCVQDSGMNFMVPGLAATKAIVKGDGSRLPVAEYNKSFNTSTTDPTRFQKPKHPFSQILVSSGLDKDDTRGITTSSARRETPSAVFGISTPGPIDKGTDAQRGTIGKKEHAIKNAYVGRLGGSTFVMDDGDDKFLRKKPANEGIPEYVSPEQGEKGGNVNVPHNELVRIRTRSGHQILLHNSEDLIYISHGSGNSWIEMTANGKIDVYAADSISFHTGQDFNFTADQNINFKAGGEINIVAKGMVKSTSGGNFEIKAGNTNIDGGKINLNSGLAGTATEPMRIPDKEPWIGHENLDPIAYKTETIKQNIKNGKKPIIYTNEKGSPDEGLTEPKMYKKYTTNTDTFEKVKGKEK